MPSPRTNRDLLFLHSCGPKASQLALDVAAGTEPKLATPAELAKRLDLLERQLVAFVARLGEVEALLRRRRRA